jgi:hypothetical protein
MHSHYSRFLSSIKYRCQLYIRVGTKIESGKYTYAVTDDDASSISTTGIS